MLPLALTLFASAYLAGAVLVFGRGKPGYSQQRHTISELGESGAPQATRVAALVFLPVGALMLLVACLAWPSRAQAAALALCLGVGYIVAALFPCDTGSPLSGSWRQAIHNIGGGIEYLGGAWALLRLAERHGEPFGALAMAILGAAFVLSAPPLAAVRGLVQRLAELGLFGALAWSLWRGAPA